MEAIRETTSVRRRMSGHGTPLPDAAYRELVEGLGDVAYKVDERGRVTYVSASARKALGFAPQAMLGQPISRLVHPADVPAVRRAFSRVLRGGDGSIEFRVKTAHGGYRWMRTHGRPIRLSGGRAAGACGILVDIDARRRAEDELKAMSERFEKAFHASPFLMSLTDLETGRIIDVNAAMTRLSGYRREETIGRTTLELGVWTDPAQRHRAVSALKRTKGPFTRDIEMRDRHGGLHEVLCSAVRLPIGGKSCVLVCGMDVTAQRKAEESLREAESRYRSLFENSLIGISQSRLDGSLVAANRAFANLFGYSSPKELMSEVRHVGRQLYVNPMDRERVMRALRRRDATGPREFAVRRRDGTKTHVLAAAQVVKDDRRRPVYYQAELIDISERKAAEEALRKSEEKYRALVEASFDLIYVIGADDIVWYANPSALKSLGLPASRVIGQPRASFFPPAIAVEQKRNLDRVLSTGKPFNQEYKVAQEGPVKWEETQLIPLTDRNGKVEAVLGVSRDITARKRAEERVRSFSRKVLDAREEERKRVAAALHHDVGSLAVGLSARFDAIEDDVRSGKTRRALASARAARRLFDRSVAHLKGVAAGLRPPDLDILGLRAALRQHFVHAMRHGSVRICFADSMGKRRVTGDTATVLFRVAQEALTNAVRHGRATRVDVRLAASAKTCRLTIGDNGRGFDAAEAGSGDASRMGLRMMQEMATSVGGTFAVESVRGRGTRVRVILPLDGVAGRSGDDPLPARGERPCR